MATRKEINKREEYDGLVSLKNDVTDKIHNLNHLFVDQISLFDLEFYSICGKWMFLIYNVSSAELGNDILVVSSDSMHERYPSFEEAIYGFFKYIKSEHWFNLALKYEREERERFDRPREIYVNDPTLGKTLVN